MARDLIVGYDGSECAKAALRAGAELAAALGDRVVITFGYEPGGYGEEHSEHRRAVEEIGARVTEEAKQLIADQQVEVEIVLRADRPVDALLAEGDERDARLIVVGTHGEHPLKGAFLGSTPHKLVHLAERPVLVVPAP